MKYDDTGEVGRTDADIITLMFESALPTGRFQLKRMVKTDLD